MHACTSSWEASLPTSSAASMCQKPSPTCNQYRETHSRIVKAPSRRYSGFHSLFSVLELSWGLT